MEKVNAKEIAAGGIGRNSVASEEASATGVYTVTCIGQDGQEKWSDTIQNLVTTVGKNDLLDKYFAGVTYTANWYMGLVDGGTTPTYAAGDTLASHAGWTEYLNYTVSGSGTNRATPTWNSATGGSTGTGSTQFTISGAGGTVAGCLMCTTLARNTASNGGTGVLYSVGAFGGGNKVVVSGDTLNVTYTAAV